MHSYLAAPDLGWQGQGALKGNGTEESIKPLAELIEGKCLFLKTEASYFYTLTVFQVD